MRNGILLLFLFLTLAGCQNPVAWWRDRPLLPNGRVVANTPEGLPRYEKEWRGGKRHGIWRDYYPSGKQKEMYVYDNGIPEGKWSAWFENGQLQRLTSYRNGAPDGHWITWHANGHKAFDGTYVNGKEEGLFQNWNEKGEITESANWKNGVRLPDETLQPKGTR